LRGLLYSSARIEPEAGDASMPIKSAPPKKRPSKARGFIKVASLGLVGLIAGILIPDGSSRR
jgi:hypothetical protein